MEPSVTFGSVPRARRRDAAGMLMAALLVACASQTASATVIVEGTRGRLVIDVEVADTPSERSRGLMRRRDVPAGTGMLFRYEGPGRWGGFWMKDTLVALDIAFMRDGRVTEVFTMQPCRADPCPLTKPAEPYDSALEVREGTYRTLGIEPGAAVRVSAGDA